MQTKHLAIAGFCFLFACRPTQSDKIQVTGKATMKVVPDMVELSLKAYYVRSAMKEAVIETQSAINQILAVSHRYIARKEDIKVRNVATNKDYEYNGGRQVFRGYNAEQVLEVRLRD